MTNRFNIYQTAKLALATGLMALAPSVASAQAQCSSLHLNGAYAFIATGFITVPGPPVMLTPANQVGVLTFDGDGKLTLTLVAGVSAFGGPTTPTSFSGTYTVDPDCNGIIAVKFSDTFISRAAFVLADGRKTIYAITIDSPPGNTLSLTLTKVL